MGCYYALVQYVPETAVDDRLTVGMVAIDDETGHGASVFTSNWDRVRCFGDQQADYLRDFVKELRDEVGDARRMTVVARSREWLEDYTYHFRNSIQFSQIAWAPTGADEWIDRFGPIYVRGIHSPEEQASQEESYDQDRLATETRHLVGDLLDSRFGFRSGRKLVRERKIEVESLRAVRTIDAALQNGALYFGALTTTLSKREGFAQRQIDYIYQSALDIRTVYADLPLIVITSPVKSDQENLAKVDNVDAVFQLQRRCRDANVPVARLDQPDRIADLMEHSLTREALDHLRSLSTG